MFLSSFIEIIKALFQIFLIGIVGAVLIRKKVFKKEHLKALSDVTIKMLLPALIFSKTIQHFDPSELEYWWVLPIFGAAMPLLGIGLGSLFFIRKFQIKKNLLPLAGIQNALYLVLPIGQIVFPEQFDTFALYVFLYILGNNPVLWSIGKYLCTSGKKKYKIRFKDFITPPLIANFLSVAIVLLKLHIYIPEIIIQPINLVGSATVPIATFILGATLGTISLKKLPSFFDILKIVSVKFIFIPVITFIFIYFSKLYQTDPLLSSLLMIQASSAPAANIIVIIKSYGGDIEKLGSLMLVSYIICIIILPLWLAVYNMLL